MAIAKMGKLVEVDIRKLWEHEQYDFSKWLSDKEKGLYSGEPPIASSIS